MTGGNGMFSFGIDEDGWINGQMTGAGPTGDDGLMAGADDGGSGMVVVVPSEELGPGTNTGDGLLMIRL